MSVVFKSLSILLLPIKEIIFPLLSVWYIFILSIAEVSISLILIMTLLEKYSIVLVYKNNSIRSLYSLMNS